MTTKEILYIPGSHENPYQILDMKTTEERLQIALWYPFSVRSLIFDGKWYEHCRCSSRDNAYHIMKALAASKNSALNIYVVVQFLRLGKEGREKAVMGFEYYPNEIQRQERQN